LDALCGAGCACTFVPGLPSAVTSANTGIQFLIVTSCGRRGGAQFLGRPPTRLSSSSAREPRYILIGDGMSAAERSLYFPGYQPDSSHSVSAAPRGIRAARGAALTAVRPATSTRASCGGTFGAVSREHFLQAFVPAQQGAYARHQLAC